MDSAYAKIRLGSGQLDVERGQNQKEFYWVESVELFWVLFLKPPRN